MSDAPNDMVDGSESADMLTDGSVDPPETPKEGSGTDVSPIGPWPARSVGRRATWRFFVRKADERA